MTDETLRHFDLSLPQQRRQYEKHKAALQRIQRETAEQGARAAKFAAKWKEERRAQCGTTAGYSRHRREGDEPCRPCVEANREYNRQTDRRKRERKGRKTRRERNRPVRKLRPCGTTAAARRHHRKGEELCDLCRETHRQDMAELNATRKRLQAEGKTLKQETARKRAEAAAAERRRRAEDENLMECCGAPKDEPAPTSKYSKRHWQAKTVPCEPARLSRNLGDRRRWARDNGAPREKEPCGTAAGFARHKYHKEEPCQPCRDARNAVNNIYKKRHREKIAALMACCGAPKAGGDLVSKYVWRHRQEGTPPCRPAKECRNALDRKNYETRRYEDDVNERRGWRRGWTIDPETQKSCCGAPLAGDEPTGKYVKRHEHGKTVPCRQSKDCRNLRDRKGTRPPLLPCGTRAAYRRHLRAGETPCGLCREANRRKRRGAPSVRKPAADVQERREAFQRNSAGGPPPAGGRDD